MVLIQTKYKKLEVKLAEFIKCEEQIIELEKQMKYLKDDITLSGIAYDGVSTSPTNKVVSVVENEVVGRSEKMEYFKHEIKQYEDKIKEVGFSFRKLDIIEYTIIMLRHGKYKDWRYISDKVGYSIPYCQEMRRKAVKTLL